MGLKRVLVAALLSLPLLAVAENTLQGNWVLPAPNNPQCGEHYQFQDGGEFAVNSDQEQVTGRYDVVQTGSLPQLNMVFVTDNNMADCFGNQVDQTGQTDTHFLKWEHENMVQFCSDVLGQNCPVSLYRQ